MNIDNFIIPQLGQNPIHYLTGLVLVMISVVTVVTMYTDWWETLWTDVWMCLLETGNAQSDEIHKYYQGGIISDDAYFNRLSREYIDELNRRTGNAKKFNNDMSIRDFLRTYRREVGAE